MNAHVHRFYRKFADEQAPIRLYHEVIGLHETPRVTWDDISKKVPTLPKGWYELAQLEAGDRVEFSREFWLSTLPYVPHVHASLQKFFDELDDIGIYLTQLRYDSAFECEIAYSLGDGSCFYHGSPPCSLQAIATLQREFNAVLPQDYLSFLRIHDGFSRHTDTGIIPTNRLSEIRRQLIEEFRSYLREFSSLGRRIDPSDLIPFYESFGQPNYQCFFAAWTPAGQTGNVYYSMFEKTISDLSDPTLWQENLAFTTFLDWLIFYLESIE